MHVTFTDWWWWSQDKTTISGLLVFPDEKIILSGTTEKSATSDPLTKAVFLFLTGFGLPNVDLGKNATNPQWEVQPASGIQPKTCGFTHSHCPRVLWSTCCWNREARRRTRSLLPAAKHISRSPLPSPSPQKSGCIRKAQSCSRNSLSNGNRSALWWGWWTGTEEKCQKWTSAQGNDNNLRTCLFWVLQIDWSTNTAEN